MNTMNTEPTGERLEVTDLSENTSEHLHRYALARTLCSNKNVLDIACGEGYGSNLLAESAGAVSGVDLDNDVVNTASKKYKRANLSFKQGDATKIPFDNAVFDVVVSFETLEHHDKHLEMMVEVKRVLKPGGILIISTPDKLIYSDKKKYANPFHIKELYKEEFRSLLKGYFYHVTILKQRFYSGSLVVPEGDLGGAMTAFEGGFSSVNSITDIESEYLIAIASDSIVAISGTSLFIDNDFAKKKILDFQQQSIRYKVGKAVLSPGRILKELFGAKRR
jgi:ubiquinone/menaquinone biosynthesis C-methylase UbiE